MVSLHVWPCGGPKYVELRLLDTLNLDSARSIDVRSPLAEEAPHGTVGVAQKPHERHL